MKIIYDNQLESVNKTQQVKGPLRVLLMENFYTPGELILKIERGDLSEMTMTPEEVGELGRLLEDSQRFSPPLPGGAA
jgi:hypothetical protein